MTDFEAFRRERYLCAPVTPDERPARLALSDVVAHLPVLEWFASRCSHATEFGVRDAHSTAALLAGCPGEVVSCDVQESPAARALAGMALPCRWRFVRMDTGAEADAHLVGETDLLFIDTLHTAEHLAKELRLHGRKAAKYLIFHDTATCGEFDRSGPNPSATGISVSIRHFLAMHPKQYETAYETTRCNGLLVLRRLTNHGY